MKSNYTSLDVPHIPTPDDIRWDATLPMVEECMEVMLRLWTGWENVLSEPLLATWRQLFQGYREQVLRFDDPEASGTFYIYAPATGSGKSVSLRVWCALLSRLGPDVHPGMRVVVRQQLDADEFAREVNALALELKVMHPAYESREYAIAWHSENRELHAPETLDSFPCVCTCHKGLELSMGYLGTSGVDSKNQEYLATYSGHLRYGLVVDECLALLQLASVEKEMLYNIERAISDDLRETSLRGISEWLKKLAVRDPGEGEDGKIYEDAIKIDGGALPNLRKLRAVLKHTRIGRGWKFSKATEKELHKKINQALDQLEALMRAAWVRYKKNHEGVTLSSADTTVPEGWERGAIVLDASAHAQRQYHHLKKFERVPVIPNLRTYRRATLHVAKGFGVGKNTLARTPAQMARIAKKLPASLPPLEGGATGLLITHQDLAVSLSPKGVLPEGWQVIYWGGRATGTNEWRDCKICVVYGLQIFPSDFGANAYRGLCPPEPGVTLTAEELADMQEEYRRLEYSQLIVTTCQGIGRSALRKSVTPEGDCPEDSHVFLIYPDDLRGDAVYKGIVKEFPGLGDDPVQWDYQATAKAGTRKAKRSPKKATLMLRWLLEMPKGMEITREDLRMEPWKGPEEKGRGIPERSMERFITRFKKADISDRPIRELVDIAGMSYEEGGGRGKPSKFRKA